MAQEDPERPCDTHVLARGPLGAVHHCMDCGQVHLTLSYLTLRLQPEAFRELVGMVATALQRLPATAAVSPLAHGDVRVH